MLTRHLLETLYAADAKKASLQIDIYMRVPLVDPSTLPPPPPLQRQRRYVTSPLNEASRLATDLINRRPHLRNLLTQWAATSSRRLPHSIKADIKAIREFVAHQSRDCPYVNDDLTTLYLLRELERLVGDTAKTATLNLAIRQIVVAGELLKEYADADAAGIKEAQMFAPPYEHPVDPEEAYSEYRYYQRILKQIQDPQVYEWRLGGTISLAEYLPALHTDMQLAIGAATRRLLMEDKDYRKWRRYAALAVELYRRLPILQHMYSAWLEPEDAAAAAATTAPVSLNARILDQYLLLSDSLEESAAAGYYAGILSSPVVPPLVSP
jgi:hypothetical protein